MKTKIKLLIQKGKSLGGTETQNMEAFINNLCAKEVDKCPSPSEESPSNPIHSIVVVGFDHKKGSVVEYQYPSDAQEFPILPYLSLPDSVHNESHDFLYFTLQSGGQYLYCVSCFRQVRNSKQAQSLERNCVQKAVVVVSRLPYLGLIASRMQATTEVYFEQENFENTQILKDMYESLQNSFENTHSSQLNTGFSTRKLLMTLKENLMVLFKLLLLEAKVIVFSKKPSNLSCAIWSLLSLYPGQLCFRSKHFRSYLGRLGTYGLPLELFHSNCELHPYFSIFQLEDMQAKGYLMGCTNEMIVQHPKSEPHAILDLDSSSLTVLLTKQEQKALKLSKHEKLFIKNLVRVISNQKTDKTFHSSESWFGSENLEWEGSNEHIKTEFHNFLKEILSNLALLKLKFLGDTDYKEAIPSDSETEEQTNNYLHLDPKLGKFRKYKKFTKGFKKEFLIKWSYTSNFKVWARKHPKVLGVLSPLAGNLHSGPVQKVRVVYENGETYTGSMQNGKRQGVGVLTDREGNKYEGEWQDNMVCVY